MLQPTEEDVDRWNLAHSWCAEETLETYHAKLKQVSGKYGDPSYRFSAEVIDAYRSDTRHLGNYGVTPVTLTIIDADNIDELESRYRLLSRLPETFMVKSGRENGKGRHIYLKVTDIPDDNPYRKDKIVFAGDLGDVRFPGHVSYVIGPYSLHPDGARYLPVNNLPAAEISYSDFIDIIKDIPVQKKDRTVSTEMADLRKRAERKAAYSGGSVWFDMIAEYNNGNAVEDFLPSGYVQAGSRWKSPDAKKSSGAGIMLKADRDGVLKLKCFHTDDRLLNTDTLTGTYDLLVRMEGEKEAQKTVIEYVKQHHPDLYQKFINERRVYRTAQYSEEHRRKRAAIPGNPLEERRE